MWAPSYEEHFQQFELVMETGSQKGTMCSCRLPLVISSLLHFALG